MNEIILKNADLKRLYDDGYSVGVKDGCLYIENIPVLNNAGSIAYTYLICPLDLSGDNMTSTPTKHIVYIAELPHRKENESTIINDFFGISQNQNINGIMLHQLSRIPSTQHYADYYQKMTTYVNILTESVSHIDSTVNARKGVPSTIVSNDNNLKHIDTNASRANIAHLNKLFEDKKVAIIGIGGTGSYILDLISRLPLEQIGLFDDDTYSIHNFFRAPGNQESNGDKSKTQVFYEIYSNRHKNITATECKINESNLALLDNFDFIFICIDSMNGRKTISDYLNQRAINYIDTGIGMGITVNGLYGQVRISNSLFIDDVPEDENNIYKQNIQIAEVNSLAASIAVIEWKKRIGYYWDGNSGNNNIIVDIQVIG